MLAVFAYLHKKWARLLADSSLVNIFSVLKYDYVYYHTATRSCLFVLNTVRGMKSTKINIYSSTCKQGHLFIHKPTFTTSISIISEREVLPPRLSLWCKNVSGYMVLEWVEINISNCAWNVVRNSRVSCIVNMSHNTPAQLLHAVASMYTRRYRTEQSGMRHFCEKSRNTIFVFF